MLDILLIIIAMTSCIDSQAREIIDTAKEATEMANDTAKNLQPGYFCYSKYLCCKEYAITGLCCNYFPL